MAKKRKSHRRPKRSAPRRKSTTRRNRFFLPWPLIFFLLLCVGVLLVGWTLKAGADDIKVTAKVPADPLTITPVITYPADGARISTVPTPVRGTCETDSYLKIYRNDFYSGSVLCSSDGTFEINIDLFEGSNDLVARSFNLTDDEGPTSNTVTVYYVPEIPIPSPPPGQPVIKTPFTISTDYKYVGYDVGQTSKWKLYVHGGYPPYAINIDWGDGTNSVYSQKEAGTLEIEHQYKYDAGDGKNTYTIKISGSDSIGRKAYLEIFVIVNSKDLPAAGFLKRPSDNWLIIAWPTYIVLLLMLTSFWLGEREELLLLKKRGRLKLKRS